MTAGEKRKLNKSALAQSLGISRSLLYYEHRQPIKDWQLKQEIEKVLRKHPSYGHKRIALYLGINKKRASRVMKLFGIKPYRRRGQKWRKTVKAETEAYPNLLLDIYPEYPGQIWASDFTQFRFQGKWIYLATVVDLFSRELVGFSILTAHTTQLVIGALLSAIHKHPIPQIIHSDQGSEYLSQDYVALTSNLGMRLSMSRKGCPWENGYQESFYSQFKVDLGDPNRFNHLGELIYEIYKMIHIYNNARIHTALRMSPVRFTQQFYYRERVSKIWGT